MGYNAATLPPAGHLDSQAPGLAGMLDLDGTEFGATGSSAPRGSVRSFRATSRGDAAPDTIALHDGKAARVGEHSTAGEVDARRGMTTVLPEAKDELAASTFANDAALLTFVPEAPPERPRQGFTGADPARPAWYRRPLFIRPFDKAMTDHPISVLKVEMDGPLASRPKDQLADVGSSQPYAGGSTGTQHVGVGPSRNSFRIMPKAWDTLLVDTGGPAVSAAIPDPGSYASTRQASRSFRA